MNHLGETRLRDRRRFLSVGITLFGSGLVLGASSVLCGCGDDKGQITQVENAPDPKTVAQDSMQFGSKNAKTKTGSKK
jgi:hypothetical protein